MCQALEQGLQVLHTSHNNTVKIVWCGDKVRIIVLLKLALMHLFMESGT